MDSFSYFFLSPNQCRDYRAPSELLDLSVQFAQLEDLSGIVDILAHSFYPRTGFGRWLFPILRMGIYEDLRQHLCYSQSPHCVCLVAKVSSSLGSQVIGTVEVSFRPSSPFHLQSLYYPYISNLAVQSKYRQKGVAQRLLGACEALAAEYGCLRLYLHVLEDNHPAKQLYLKAGYRLHQSDSSLCSILMRRSRRLLFIKELAGD